jgi:uncharacterized repeat protein (TIGR03803 family)
MSKIVGREAACSILLLMVAWAIAAPAQTFSVLANFDGANGSGPLGSLVQGTDGNFYGTTFLGGANGFGTIFQITPGGLLTNLYSFCSQTNCADGAAPYAELALGSDGNFYGTTSQEGAGSGGTVFKVTPEGALTTLYSFCSQPNCADGSSPAAGVTLASNGLFYGTTFYGGLRKGKCASTGCGTVFKITPEGKLTTIHEFCAQEGCADGFAPTSVIQGTTGDFYGTASSGGNSSDDGMIFKITPGGKFTTLFYFDGTDGKDPYAGLIEGLKGKFDGTAHYGGGHGAGAVYQILPGGTEKTVYNFCALSGCADGSYPYGELVEDTNLNVYSTTYFGGANNLGTVFELGLDVFNLTTLHSFDGADGSNPEAGLLLATDGIFYGSTSLGGSSGNGTLFSLSTGLAPFVSFVFPAGKAGQTSQILGQGFTGATSVSFNRIDAKFNVVSDTYLTATVPAGATTGYVTVTTPTGVLTSNVPFHEIP